MADYIHHHFVPKSYLKEFGIGNGNDLSVFTQEISSKHFNPRKVNVGNAIGQIEHFYKINTENSLFASQFGQDPNVIEKKGFEYEKYLPHLFNKLRKKNVPQIVLKEVEVTTMIRALISVKFRNPFIREAYMKSSRVFDEIALKLKIDLLKELEERKRSFVDEGKEIFDGGIEELKRKLVYDFENHREFIKTIHSAGIYYPDSTIKQRMNILGTYFLKYRWEIIQTSVDKQFITSDNPGVFLTSDGYVYSLIFEQFKEKKIERFFFPLSPLHGLLINFRELDTYSDKNKLIQCVYSPKSVVEYNVCHCCHVNNILIASSKKALEDTFEKGKSQWIDVKTRE